VTHAEKQRDSAEQRDCKRASALDGEPGRHPASTVPANSSRGRAETVAKAARLVRGGHALDRFGCDGQPVRGV
jgi:hypothetical protein